MIFLTEIIAEKLQVGLDCDINITSRIRYSGTEYRTGRLICIKIEDEMPVFSKITGIVREAEQYLLVASEFETVCFVEYLHSFHAGGTWKNVPFDLQTSYGFEEPDLHAVPLSYLMYMPTTTLYFDFKLYSFGIEISIVAL